MSVVTAVRNVSSYTLTFLDNFRVNNLVCSSSGRNDGSSHRIDHYVSLSVYITALI